MAEIDSTNRRIAIVSVAPTAPGKGSAHGGVAEYTRTFIKLVSSLPYEFIVIANDDAASEWADKPTNVQVQPIWKFGSPIAGLQILRALQKTQPDLVHVQHETFLYGAINSVLFPIWSSFIARRIPLVTTIHGVITPQDIDKSLIQTRGARLPFWAVRAALSHIFKSLAAINGDIVVHEPVLKERLETLGCSPQCVHVIGHPRKDPSNKASQLPRMEARRQLSIPQDEFVALSWGFANAYKGFDELVEGFALFSETMPTSRLVLGIGPHPQMKSSTAYMREYDLQMSRYRAVAGVDVRGFIPDDLIDAYIEAADVTIFAYTKYLAASGPMARSLALGKPILASMAFAHLPEEIKLTPTPEGISAALWRFIENPVPIKNASRAAQAIATNDDILTAYETLYDTALRRSHGA